jgi:hypothetical protein
MADAILRMTKPGLAAESQRAVKVASSGTQHQLKSAVRNCVACRRAGNQGKGLQNNAGGQGGVSE